MLESVNEETAANNDKQLQNAAETTAAVAGTTGENPEAIGAEVVKNQKIAAESKDGNSNKQQSEVDKTVSEQNSKVSGQISNSGA